MQAPGGPGRPHFLSRALRSRTKLASGKRGPSSDSVPGHSWSSSSVDCCYMDHCQNLIGLVFPSSLPQAPPLQREIHLWAILSITVMAGGLPHRDARLPFQSHPQPPQAFVTAQVTHATLPGPSDKTWLLLPGVCCVTRQIFQGRLMRSNSGLKPPGFKSPLCHLRSLFDVGQIIQLFCNSISQSVEWRE